MKNVQKKKQVDKWLNYCLDNGIDTKKVFGNKSIEKVVTNQKYYNQVKTKIAYERTLLNEKESNKIVLDKIEKDRKKAREKQDILIQKHMIKNIGMNDNTLSIWENKEELGLTKKDLISSNLLEITQQKSTKDFIDKVTQEIKYLHDGDSKNVGAFFKYHKDDDDVKGALNYITEKLKNDKNATYHTNVLVNYLYNDILIQKYYSENSEYGQIGRRADEKFWSSVSSQLMREYDRIYEEANR